MKQLLIPRYGPPSVLTVREAPDPPVTLGSVRIRVTAAGINFADLMARQGLYPDAPKPPCVVGYEVAGVVDAVGDGVTTPRVGDRVIALTRFGGQSDVVVVPPAQVFPLPGGWTFEQGAALPVTYLTAHHMLDRVAAARTGETVLVHAAAGGVGIAVAELARIMELRVLGLASPSKHETLRSYGVEPLDRTDSDWPAAVRRLAPSGVDVVLDAVGGDSWRRGYALLAPAGRLVCYGVSELSSGLRRNLLGVVWKAIRWPRFGPVALMNDNRAVAGVNIGHLWSADALIRPQIERLLGYAREGRIRPRVDRAFPLVEAAAAHQYIHERRNIGKVVLTFEG
ncbi:MAG TPA: medium chain dehydrogenase/reductase family protein [Gemmatimonadales bacterium]|nr:medium chain dehydrogenase/reductase family protein [Gemmatimonadales bacterium]